MNFLNNNRNHHKINSCCTSKGLIFNVILLTLLVLGCKEKTLPDYMILSGNITNKTSDILTFSDIDGIIRDSVTVHPDGSFKDTLHLNNGEYMLNKRMPIYLSAGNEISLTYNATDLTNTITFSGKGFETSKYLVEKIKKRNELKGDRKDFYALDEASFIEKLKEIKSMSENLLNGAENIPEDFKVMERRNIYYANLGILDRYESNHRYWTKQPDFKASEGFLSELGTLTFDKEEDFLFSKIYRALVFRHFTKKRIELMKRDSLSYEESSFKIVSGIKNEAIKNWFLFNFGKFQVTETNNLESFYKSFMAASTNNLHKEEVTKKYNTLLKLSKGQVSPKFYNYENHAGGTTSLDDLKGKYVYIDVWATWCAPCKKEIPFLKEVEEKYHEKNIEFVSISVDNGRGFKGETPEEKMAATKEGWKKMIIEKELGGIQLFADKGFNSKFVQDYLLTGIPRFILIDPQGNIVNSEAPRPSDKKLIELFDELKI